MIRYLILMILFCSTAFAGQVVCSNANGEITDYGSGNLVDGCLFYDPPHTHTQEEYDRVAELFKDIDRRYIKILNNSPVEMSPQEKVTVDDEWAAEIQTNLLTSSRAGAKDSVDQLSAEGVRLRAALLIILDEMNILRTRDRDRSADVAAATNLADLKTRWAARVALDDRTAAQMKTSIKSRIDAGDAD